MTTTTTTTWCQYNACIQYMRHCSRKNTTTTTTQCKLQYRSHHHLCQQSICASWSQKKAPPVQVTVATTTCVSRVSALVGHRKRPPVQVTVAPAPFAPPHVPESKCAQWLKKKTTSASYSWSEPAPPPLECTLQQANVSLPKGMPLNFFPCTLNSMACPQASLHLLAAACTPMVAVQVLTGCNLRWWSFSSAIERIYFLAHVVVRMVCVLVQGHCNLHWWSFSMTNQRRYSTGTCGGGYCNLHWWWSFSMTNQRRYSTGTCGGGYCNYWWWSFSMTNQHRYSTGTGGGGCDIVTCTVWWWYIYIYQCKLQYTPLAQCKLQYTPAKVNNIIQYNINKEPRRVWRCMSICNALTSMADFNKKRNC